MSENQGYCRSTPYYQIEPITALSAIQERSPADADILREVNSSNVPLDKRLRLIDALTRSQRTPEVLDALGKCLSDPEAKIQVRTLFALQNIGPSVATLAPQLLLLAKAGQPPLHVDLVLNLLARCKPMPKDLEPVAAKYLQSQRLAERSGATSCLANAEGLQEGTISLLLRSLKDKDISVRLNATNALGHCTSQKDVIMALRQLSTNDPHPVVRARASETLKENQEK